MKAKEQVSSSSHHPTTTTTTLESITTTYRQINTIAQKLPLSVSLLIEAAQNKGINVNLWLNGQQQQPTDELNQKMPTHEFCSKFITLALIISIEQTPFQSHI
jgi:hypothetical protein